MPSRVWLHPRPSDPQLCERGDGGRQTNRVSTRELVPNVLRQSSIRGHRGDASIHTPVDNPFYRPRHLMSARSIPQNSREIRVPNTRILPIVANTAG
jgi:hypothetical protein